METSKWYGVRTVYEHVPRGSERLYEERIVLIRASSNDEALAKAERDAESYATEGTRYLGYTAGFEMYGAPGERAEVFSLLRDSRLEPKQYLNEFFDTGQERTS